jgi:cellulose synthase/poly-beta-1,6-N-acetylglucosamine synthase-like glycosyltransferase
MFISVVVPALNEQKCIGQCLSSLTAQSYPWELYEIIVVDNASTDRTSEIALRFGAKVVYEAETGIGRRDTEGLKRPGVISWLERMQTPLSHSPGSKRPPASGVATDSWAP